MTSLFLQEAMMILQEKEDKKQVVLTAVAPLCQEHSEFSGLASLAVGLQQGGTLDCKVISGGKTNYSYQVYLKEDPSKKVFAKLAFDYALWNPDRTVHYDLQRTVNEYDIMNMFANIMGEYAPVAQPYHLVRIDHHTMMLVTEWASAGDEQWANQFIDGKVDMRIIPKIANALATLNLFEDFDPKFNDNARPCLLSLFEAFKDMFRQTINNTTNNDPNDSSIAVAREIGLEEFSIMIDNMEQDYMQRECLIHNDAHVFNLLVEKKPSDDDLDRFGDKASLYICDWEMAVAGPAGADPGKFFGYPLACAICHAMNGNKESAYHLLECTNEFWKVYEEILSTRGGKDTNALANIFRQALGWASYFLYNGFNQLDLFVDTMPIHDLAPDDIARTRGAWSSLGLRLMHIAYGSNRQQLSLVDYKILYNNLVTEQIEVMLGFAYERDGPSRRLRRSSTLRASGKRISDAMDMADVVAIAYNLSVEAIPSSNIDQRADSISQKVAA
ncbi:phosphotransferase enzyme family protein [Nitzschia inconspicua]|uniref:Phosphotransferase enzyme family protein n=1 Tax=Nitzschia inconspicua TaxID=303405 RepID=A0A9K3KBS0_9STRA|nr:phosphotransferase enzyme family protein [Nitzschia inconspicua]